MRERRGSWWVWIAFAAVLTLPVGAGAFVLIELLIQVNLLPGEVVAVSYEQLQLPNTGFTIRNVEGGEVSIDGSSRIDSDGLLPGETVQEGFVLLDRTLEVEVSALDQQGGRASVRTTYQRDVGRASLQREFIRARLLEQRVVTDGGRARQRARAMGLEDARVMRFITGDGGGTWARAVRALDSGRIAFKPGTEPDGVLGHFGTAVSAEGDPYVWAVMDRNSRYGVGLTVDRDADGVPNAGDNCVGTVNANQNDFDGDGAGDECDLDDDDDGVPDDADNCPLAANGGQEDADGDGVGDECDLDDDNDGVVDGDDLCLGTAAGATVDGDGCSIADYCPCENDWRNHGAYVRCVAHTSEAFATFGLITEPEKDAVVSAAGQSSCGF